jgi:glycosyltransferase involved in cell wall biosynthesis
VTAPVVVNGRFLRGTPTGLHRVGRSLLDAMREAGLEATVVAPSGVDDPRVDETWGAPGGTAGDHLWEQVVLPRRAGDRVVLSLANTAPVLARRGVVLVHDLAPLVGPQWFAPRMRAYARLVLTAARRAEAVLTVSHVVADELRANGVTAPVTVVHNAVDDGVTAPPPPDVDAALDRLAVRRPYVLFVGWADPRKDVGTAVAAHRLAARTDPHRLVLTGLAHRNFAPVVVPDLDTVLRPGYVDDADLRALLAGASALLYPSRYEGFGTPPLEAWACGTPALVSDIPVLRESTEGRATYLPVGDVAAWAAAIGAAVRDEVTAPTPSVRRWSDAAQDALSALAALR